jgi:uncharacterized protein YjiS (DUF1127 family)
MYDPNHPPLARLHHAGVLASAGRALRRLGHKVAAYRHNRRAYEELAAMTDHELEDIGLSRSEIDAAFAGTYKSSQAGSSNVIVLDHCRYRDRPTSMRRCNEGRR